jgi:hypothetical protein
VIVNDLDHVHGFSRGCSTQLDDKAPLIIEPHRVLPCADTLERFEAQRTRTAGTREGRTSISCDPHGAGEAFQVEQALAEIKKVQDEVRRLGLAEHMLTDDDLYDENGLPK